MLYEISFPDERKTEYVDMDYSSAVAVEDLATKYGPVFKLAGSKKDSLPPLYRFTAYPDYNISLRLYRLSSGTMRAYLLAQDLKTYDNLAKMPHEKKKEFVFYSFSEFWDLPDEYIELFC